MDLSTTYLGLSLKNPIIVGSSGMTGTVKNIKELEESGAAAVVLKSLFQEEIYFESEEFIRQMKKYDASTKYFDYDGHKNPIDFYGYKVREDNLNHYRTLIKEVKESVSIPVIASVNCFFDSLEWIAFAKEMEQDGADALELNMFFPPSDFSRTREEKEALYFKTIQSVLDAVTIPVSLKIGYYFTDLGPMIQKLSETGIKGLVLFNRFFSPDFDIEKYRVKPSHVFSSPSELAIPLRWVAIMSEKVSCDLVASTGVHDGDGVIKQILAGAKAVQIASVLYKNGKGCIPEMVEHLRSWMVRKNFPSIEDFRGKMSQEKSSDPAMYERAQFMKYYAGRRDEIT